MRTILTLLLCCLLYSCTSKEKQPNIIYIMSDDHAAHAIGAYNGRLAKLNPTPNLDKLAEDGILFENCFVTNSICTPSRATIISGQYSQTNGILDLDGELDPKKQYLPQEMKKLGYQTAIIGKWHLKIEPSCFDYYSVLKGQGKYFNPEFYDRAAGSYPNNMVTSKGHSSDVITDKVIDWIKGRKNNEKPFFLMYHFKAPHDWFEYAPRYEEYLSNEFIPEPKSLYEQPNWGSEATRGKNDSLRHCIGSSVSRRHTYAGYVQQYEVADTISDKEATSMAYQKYLKSYLRCVKGVDDNLGRFFKYLKDNNLYENTIIVYSADQGMMLGEHDMVDKRWMYEESMQMPLIVHDPRVKEKGIRKKEIINNTDFAPSLINLAGGTVPEYMQGKSIKPILENKTPENWRKATYYRYWMHITHHDIPAHFGLRNKDYKLIFFYGRHWDKKQEGDQTRRWLRNGKSFIVRPTPVAWEFYDLKNDPKEVNNVYSDPRYKEIIKEMKEELKIQRDQYNETDQNFPHIQNIVKQHWND